MTTKLKSLYEKLVNQRRDKEEKEKIKGIKQSHDEHKKLSDKVKIIKGLIKSKNPKWKQDKEFLEDLLYKKDNGIASAGQSMLSKEQFHSFIENDNFMSALGELILNPTETTLRRFEKAWEGQKGSSNLIRILRIVAASTMDVSTTVHMPKFEKVFDWLIAERIIPDYSVDDSHYSKGQQWFSKNQFLMKEIKKQFQDELKSKTTDEVYLCHFVWYLYKHSKPFHSKLKIRISR